MRNFLLFLCICCLSCTIRDKKPDIPSAASPYQNMYNLIEESQKLLREGDLIVRNGQGFSSQIIKGFNRKDQTYSHGGLVFFKNGIPFIYHIVTGDPNPDIKLRYDSLKSFCNPRNNLGFAIYRYNLNEAEIKKLRESIEEWYTEGVSFDSTFNLETDERMYCSEMIKKGLANATNNRIVINTTKPTAIETQFFSTHLRLPLEYTKNLDVVALDNLFLDPNCQLVKRFDYNFNQ